MPNHWYQGVKYNINTFFVTISPVLTKPRSLSNSKPRHPAPSENLALGFGPRVLSWWAKCPCSYPHRPDFARCDFWLLPIYIYWSMRLVSKMVPWAQPTTDDYIRAVEVWGWESGSFRGSSAWKKQWFQSPGQCPYRATRMHLKRGWDCWNWNDSQSVGALRPVNRKG